MKKPMVTNVTKAAPGKASSLEPGHNYAQTNLQLYEQMRRLGYNAQDIARVRQAYDLAIRLFSSQYRANGKPFINHLVGTASIVLSRSLPTSLAITGLMHASYTHGRAAFPRPNFRAIKRRELQRILGQEIESLVSTYTHFRLAPAVLREMAQNPGTLNDVQRNVLIVRLANDLEDHLDNGLLYCVKKKSIYNDEGSVKDLAKVAGFLEQSEIYDEIQGIRRANHTTVIPISLRNPQSDSFEVPPNPTRWLRRRLKSLLGRNE